MAQGFWAILLPHGLQGGALSHIASHQDGDGDDRMSGHEDEGWQDEHTQWWIEFLEEKKLKGVSKDVWQMVRAMFPLWLPTCSHGVVPRVCPHNRLQVREI